MTYLHIDSKPDLCRKKTWSIKMYNCTYIFPFVFHKGNMCRNVGMSREKWMFPVQKKFKPWWIFRLKCLALLAENEKHSTGWMLLPAKYLNDGSVRYDCFPDVIAVISSVFGVISVLTTIECAVTYSETSWILKKFNNRFAECLFIIHYVRL